MSLNLFTVSRAMPLLNCCGFPSLQYCTDYTIAPNLSTTLHDGVANPTSHLQPNVAPLAPKASSLSN